MALGQNNKPLSYSAVDYLKAIFESSWTYGLFTSYFDAELYRWAAFYYKTYVFGRNRPMNAVVSIAKVIEDVNISQRNYPQHDAMKHFLEKDFVEVGKAEQIADNFKVSLQTANNFKPYLTARVDIKLMTTEGDFQILSTSDDKAGVYKPNWFQRDGMGYVINSLIGELTFTANSTVDGQVSLWLRGVDKRNPEDKSKRIPYWIDYTKLIVNDKKIFDEIIPAWHDKPYEYTMEVKAGEEIKVHVEWLPHRSDT